MVPTEFKVQVVLLSVHALAFVALAVWCLGRIGTGRWAPLAALGAGLLGVAFGLQAASAIENVFFETSHIAEELWMRDHVYTVLIAAQAVGAVALVAGFVDSRRSARPAPADSMYGPGWSSRVRSTRLRA
jgi:hypothetical protein